MVVLSLFDGMSCGMEALIRAGVKVTKYYSSEIDKYAIRVSEAMYPGRIIRLGDINNWREWDIEQPDIIIGGSPCQGLSIAGKRFGLEDPRSRLFYVFDDIVKFYKPQYFFLENVDRIPKLDRAIMTGLMGVEPVRINSALVSAQNRKRLYWTNINNGEIYQPVDKHIYLKDIIDDYQGLWLKARGNNPGGERGQDGKSPCLTGNAYQENVFAIKNRGRFFLQDGQGKSQCLDANYHKGIDDHGQRTTVARMVDDESIEYRKLTVREFGRLQTLSEAQIDIMLAAGVSNTQLYKMIGNGWTVDVIKHFFEHLNQYRR